MNRVNIFRPPGSARLFVYTMTVLLPGSLLVVMLVKGHPLRDAGLVVAPFALGFAWLSLELARSKVMLDDNRITCSGPFREISLRWADIDDSHFSPRLISLVSTSQHRRLKFFRSEGGYSFEPFDVLQDEIRHQIARRLEQTWDRLRLPITCGPLGMLPGTIVGYFFVTGLAVFFPVVIAAKEEGLSFETAVFLVASIAPILPFFVRDYRRVHRVVSVEREGLRQRNGREVFIPWSLIKEIVVREPLGVGYGAIIVRSHEGKTIRIARALTNIGAVCYLLERNTDVVETYGHEG